MQRTKCLVSAMESTVVPCRWTWRRYLELKLKQVTCLWYPLIQIGWHPVNSLFFQLVTVYLKILEILVRQVTLRGGLVRAGLLVVTDEQEFEKVEYKVKTQLAGLHQLSILEKKRIFSKISKIFSTVFQLPNSCRILSG